MVEMAHVIRRTNVFGGLIAGDVSGFIDGMTGRRGLLIPETAVLP